MPATIMLRIPATRNGVQHLTGATILTDGARGRYALAIIDGSHAELVGGRTKSLVKARSARNAMADTTPLEVCIIDTHDNGNVVDNDES